MAEEQPPTPGASDPAAPQPAKVSDRIRNAVTGAVTSDRARSAVGTRAIALGLALVCLAGGVDYFAHADEIRRAIQNVAEDTGQGGLAATVGEMDAQVADWKRQAFERLPEPVREHAPAAMLALGLVALGLGLRIKHRMAEADNGRGLRDTGRVLAGPGIVGLAAFVVISVRNAAVARHALGRFVDSVRRGERGLADVAQLVQHYAPWAWHEARGVVLLGAGLVAAWVALRLFELRRPVLWVSVPRRTAGWGAFFCLAYFATATLACAVTFGVGLRVVVWPWKVNPSAFLVALAFMSFGCGLARAGAALMRRRAAEAAAAAPGPDELGPAPA